MNKDALLATVIGFGIGLIITAIVLVGPTLATSFPNFRLPFLSSWFSKSTTTPTPTPTPSVFSITIDSPIAEAIETKEILLVSGTTTNGSIVIIQGYTDEAIMKVAADGKFAGKITLLEGKNDIIVTSYLKDQHVAQTVTVFYTPEK